MPPRCRCLDIETPELLEAYLEEVLFLSHEEIVHPLCPGAHLQAMGAISAFMCTAISEKQRSPWPATVDQKILIELLQHQPSPSPRLEFAARKEHADGTMPCRLVHGT